MAELTAEETRAIQSMKRLAKRWPRSLTVFGQSGSMVIIHTADDPPWRALATISGIPCDGGDGDWEEE